MEMSNEKKKIKASDFFTVPNILSYLRILLIIPFVICFLREKYVAATVCVGASALTDCCDGYIARHFNQVTDLGKLLDPVADKLTLLAVMVCITILTPVVLPVIIILVVKDLAMLIGGSFLLKKGLKPPAAKWYGKIGTVMFYISVIVIVFLKAAFKYENALLSLILLSATAAMMIYSLVQYFFIARKMLRDQKEDLKNQKQ